MKKLIIYTTLTILILSTFASAQFPIKIPKIKVPKIPKVDKNIGENISKNVGSVKGENRQMVIDDGFTYFAAEAVKERSEKYRGNISKGWTLRSSLRAFGTFPDMSSFKIVVEDKGKTVATYQCVAARYYRKAGEISDHIRNSPIDDYMAVKGSQFCGDRKIFIKNPGKYDVKVSAVNGDNDKETLLRNYKIEVRELKKTRPGNVPDVSDYYVDRNAESAAAFLFLRPGLEDDNASAGYIDFSQNSANVGYVDIHFSMSGDRYQPEFKSPYVRCFVNGERVAFGNKGAVIMKTARSEMAVEKFDSKPGKYISFKHYSANLPIELNNPGNRAFPDMDANPGQWECQLRNNVETIRTFRWTVGSNGLPLKHPEQTGGNINLFHNAYLIDMEIPEGGSSLDVRLAPMPEDGLFYGIPWKSAEGKKMAAEVPTKGKLSINP